MNKNKRDVLKGLAVGSAWATPVVSSVVLPVHASTSGCMFEVKMTWATDGRADLDLWYYDPTSPGYTNCCEDDSPNIDHLVDGKSNNGSALERLISIPVPAEQTYEIFGYRGSSSPAVSIDATFEITTNSAIKTIVRTIDSDDTLFRVATISCPKGSVEESFGTQPSP